MPPLRERLYLILVLLTSGSLALAYVLIIPPWSAPDEPSHFQVVLEIAEHGRRPTAENTDPEIAARIINSIVWASRWIAMAGQMENARLTQELGIKDEASWQQLKADLATRDGYFNLMEQTPKGTVNWQLDEPPGYYAAEALLLLPFRARPVEQQLRVARLGSILFGLLTLVAAYGTASELFPADRLVRLALPALIGVHPSFIAQMGAVNNTIAAALALSLVLWASIRLLRRGVSGPRLLFVAAAMAGCLLAKSTAYVGAPIGLLSLALAWIKPWPRWVLPATAAGALALIPLVVRWERPAAWYPVFRDASVETQAALGDWIFVLPAADQPVFLWQNFPVDWIAEVRGKTVTVGAWMRSEESNQVQLPTIWAAPDGGELAPLWSGTAPISPEWTWHAVSVNVPTGTQCLSLVLAGGASLVEIDGIVAANGTYPTDAPPDFSDGAGRRGRWGERDFTNLARNGSAEMGWPLLSPGVVSLIPSQAAELPLNLNARIASFWDWKFNRLFLSQTVRWLFVTFWSRFAWGAPGLPVVLIGLLGILSALAGGGAVRHVGISARSYPMWQRHGLFVCLFMGAAVVGLAVLRLDPILLPTSCSEAWRRLLPNGYYVIPGIVPLMLVWFLGLREPAPPRWRRWLAAGCVLGLFSLGTASLLLRQVPAFLALYGLTIEPGPWRLPMP